MGEETKTTGFSKIGIVGLGLIGGSLAKAIHTRTDIKEIVAVDKDEASLKMAEEEEGVIDLIDELEKNGVHVLLDEIVAVGDDYYVVGRKDKSMVRMPIADLTEPLDKSRYIIAIDHQPNDYTAEKEAGCDLEEGRMRCTARSRSR